MKNIIKLIIVLYVSSIGAVTSAADELDINPVKINKVLDKSERELRRKKLRINKLDEYYTKIKAYRVWAVSCIKEKENNILDITYKANVLGDKLKGETLSVAKKRIDLFNQGENFKKALATCNVILLRTEEFINKTNLVKQKILAQELLAQGPNFFVLIADNWDNPYLWTNAVKTFVLKNSGLLDIKIVNAIILVILLLGISYVSKFYSNKISIWRSEHIPKPLLASQLLCASVITAERYIKFVPAIFVAVAFVNIVDLDVTPKPFIVIVLNGLAIVVTLNIIIHFFLNSSLSIYEYVPKTKDKAISLVHRLKVLVFIIFFGYLLFSTLLFHGLPEAVLYISRGIYGIIFVLNLIWIVWLLGYFHNIGNKLIVRMALTLIFIIALIAEWIGYRNLSLYVIEVSIGTLLLIGLYLILSKLISEFIDALDEGNIPLAKHARVWLGVSDDQHIQGLIWVHIILTLSIWIGLASLLIIVWKIPDSYTELLLLVISEGITIGSFNIIPLQIIEAVALLLIILVLNSWFKRHLEKVWLPKTSMTRSARESIAAISGYIGVLIAIIFALSFVGLDLSKLALVAGALSVGIGFGLQNVVNNFISGLILLFERPIKKGDWIVVGDVEGHVKQISIRSTRIQTFDRADVIIPNAEIISGRVTNWMLRDHSGRLRVPIGIAYGSNTELVRQVLLQVAEEHSDVIKSNSLISDPQVFFMSFGDSCLDFELRCNIYNIDNRRLVTSDLNFAIDKAFRANNISMPFPQRDIHIHNDLKKSDPEE
ncbi:MAG: mechanosensitive ion channel family protein [Thiohalomonadales bacterium]